MIFSTPPANAAVFEIRPPTLEVFEGIYQRHNNDFFFSSSSACAVSSAVIPASKRRNASSTRIPVPHRCAGTIYNINVFIIRRRDHGALIRAGKLRREGDDNGGFSLLFCLFKFA